MWEAALDGRPLHFRLVGIHDQNFLMKDDETGSWWQQVTGEAVAGPLAGRHLRQIPDDELTFATWRREHPEGRVLEPAPAFVARYAKPDWESRIARLPTVTPVDPADLLAPRDIVVGIRGPEGDVAFPLADVLSASGAVEGSVAIVVGQDGRSLRAFSRVVDGRLEPIDPVPDGSIDRSSGSTWSFAGAPATGAGPALARIPVQLDYWFDWKKYHPGTRVHGR